MKRTIKRIAPLQTGKMLGVLYTCLGLIFLPIFMLAAAAGAFAQHAQGTEASSTVPAAAVAGIMFGMGILMPVIYGVMGFISVSSAPPFTILSLAGLAVSNWKWSSHQEINAAPPWRSGSTIAKSSAPKQCAGSH
jgi:hypothetical protein